MTPHENGSVVIVDDNPNNLQILSQILAQAGYKVRPALSGEVALRAIAANPPDLVLLDIRMPEMDGYETCRRLKADAKIADVPVIFISALDQSEDRLAAFAAGGLDYISKPFQAEEVLARVRSHLQLHRMQQRLGNLVAELSEANAALVDKEVRQQELIGKLEQAQSQLVQAEKMAAIGQLAAGVAHEINNPIGFVNANLGTLDGYVRRLLTLIDAYEGYENALPADARTSLAAIKVQQDIAYLREDVDGLLRESKDGLDRVKRIVADLKVFAHADQESWESEDIESELDRILNLMCSELARKADVIKEYGHPPSVMCLAPQLNQVFMNLLMNAVQAIEGHGTIIVRTGGNHEQVWVEIQDNGKGIAPENLGRIFEPFFTTKPVGNGTGLGLSVSYGIVEKHHGTITVRSEPGKGTTFRVVLPVQRNR